MYSFPRKVNATNNEILLIKKRNHSCNLRSTFAILSDNLYWNSCIIQRLEELLDGQLHLFKLYVTLVPFLSFRSCEGRPPHVNTTVDLLNLLLMFSLFFLSHGCNIPDKDKTLVSFSSSFTIVCSFFFFFFCSVFVLNNIPEKVSWIWLAAGISGFSKQ